MQFNSSDSMFEDKYDIVTITKSLVFEIQYTVEPLMQPCVSYNYLMENGVINQQCQREISTKDFRFLYEATILAMSLQHHLGSNNEKVVSQLSDLLPDQKEFGYQTIRIKIVGTKNRFNLLLFMLFKDDEVHWIFDHNYCPIKNPALQIEVSLGFMEEYLFKSLPYQKELQEDQNSFQGSDGQPLGNKSKPSSDEEKKSQDGESQDSQKSNVFEQKNMLRSVMQKFKEDQNKKI
ncbi:UNKNOWN [Stylonychia lemnae]|uniref:Uncharacterized protein n=1 Tax=Stylonychia lemnae TaxID=5949 RepID=A0A077ZXW6_STYLE|nr:UNKNOWN [Stylonychia lemnae]|eukprot:CDW74751.1 UNKNOWN [Stylonychia lemnae]